MALSTGMFRSAHSMRRTPSSASARSFTSWRFVAAMSPLVFDSSVEVFQPDDVVQVGSRRLEDRRVLERANPVDRPGGDAEACAGRDDLHVRCGIACRAHLDLGAAGEDVPGLVLLVVELQA